jgi:hypothetical protein
MAGRTAIASITGGTASALGGGKFANGAITGAMTHLLNAETAVKNIFASLKSPGLLGPLDQRGVFLKGGSLAVDFDGSSVGYSAENSGNTGQDIPQNIHSEDYAMENGKKMQVNGYYVTKVGWSSNGLNAVTVDGNNIPYVALSHTDARIFGLKYGDWLIL